MTVLRVVLASMFVFMAAYTIPVVLNEGINLLPIFFADALGFDWTGQFVVDFAMFLGLAALWIAWRHGFSGSAILLALATIFGGMTFLAAYLFVQTYRASTVQEIILPVR